VRQPLSGLRQKPRWRSDSVPRLLLPHPDTSGKKCPGRCESLHRQRENDRGFAFVAYPAEYSHRRDDFIVGVDGVVYQKDLGKKTEVLARGMKGYNPDSSWQKTKEQEEMACRPKASVRNSGDDLLTTPWRAGHRSYRMSPLNS